LFWQIKPSEKPLVPASDDDTSAFLKMIGYCLMVFKLYPDGFRVKIEQVVDAKGGKAAV